MFKDEFRNVLSSICSLTLWVASVSVWGCQSENLFFLGAKPIQRACARDLPCDRKDERRKVREKTEEGSQSKGAEEDSWHERAVKREEEVQQKRTEETCQKNRQSGR